MRTLILTSLFIGCNSPEDSPVDTDVDTDLPPVCTAEIASISPDNGATEVELDTPIVVGFTEAVSPDDPWEITLQGAPGSSVLAEDGLSATFTPDSPFTPDTTYPIEASVCEDAALASFTTRFGVDASLLPGRTYAVSYGAINFVSPTIANTLSPADWILIQVDTVDPTGQQLTTFAGLADGATPMPDCGNSLDSGPADFSDNPLLSVGPTDFVLPVSGDTVTIEDFLVRGRFEAGAGVLSNVRISGMLDTRGITTIDGVCSLSALTGTPCEPCRDGAVRCLPIQAEADQADYWPDVDIVASCGF